MAHLQRRERILYDGDFLSMSVSSVENGVEMVLGSKSYIFPYETLESWGKTEKPKDLTTKLDQTDLTIHQELLANNISLPTFLKIAKQASEDYRTRVTE